MYIILFALISSTRLPNPQEELDYFATLWILQFSHTKSGSFFGSILTIRYEVQRRTISVIYIILFALISSISVPNPQEELGYFREIINFSIFPGDFRGGRGRAKSVGLGTDYWEGYKANLRPKSSAPVVRESSNIAVKL